jgi:hypothetical protein
MRLLPEGKVARRRSEGGSGAHARRGAHAFKRAGGATMPQPCASESSSGSTKAMGTAQGRIADHYRTRAGR